MSKLRITLLSIAVLKAALVYGQGAVTARGDGTMPLGGGPHPLVSDGTLPLRLTAGDGTLPLRLSGAATAGTTRLTTQVTLTQATQTAAANAALHCQLTGANVSQHYAQGTLAVGTSQYTVKGICYDSGSRSMEIVADHGAEQSIMVGLLPSETPRQFSGRLTLTGTQAGHYTFDVRSAAQ